MKKNPTPFEKFENLAKRVINVPVSKVEKLEKKTRKAKKRKPRPKK